MSLVNILTGIDIFLMMLVVLSFLGQRGAASDDGKDNGGRKGPGERDREMSERRRTLEGAIRKVDEVVEMARDAVGKGEGRDLFSEAAEMIARGEKKRSVMENTASTETEVDILSALVKAGRGKNDRRKDRSERKSSPKKGSRKQWDATRAGILAGSAPP